MAEIDVKFVVNNGHGDQTYTFNDVKRIQMYTMDNDKDEHCIRISSSTKPWDGVVQFGSSDQPNVYKSNYKIGDEINLDGIQSAVSAVWFESSECPKIQLQWFHNGELREAWIREEVLIAMIRRTR